MAINTKEYTATKHTGIKTHDDGLKFLCIYTVSGKRYRKTFTAKAVHSKGDRLKSAYTAREGFILSTEHDENISADTDATVGDYWLKLKDTKGWTATAISKYNYFYNKHLSYLADTKIRSIKPSHFTALNASMKDLAPSTRSKAYEILRPLFGLAVEDELIVRSPVKESHIPKRKSIEEKKIVIDAESKYRKVHEAILTLFKDNPHHRAGFLFGFHGRRLQETLHLMWEDINFESGTYIIRGEHSKVNTDMTFKLPSDVAEALSHFRSSNGMVFKVKSLDRHHQKIRDYTGINEFSFHWMRNLAVSALAGMGADITHLSAMLGHNDSGTIKKYLSLQREASTGHMEDLSRKLLS